MTTYRLVDLAYDPEEPRDDHGRWRGNHRPPGREDWESDPEHTLAGRGDMVDTVFPDFYEHPEYYRTGDTRSDRESVAALRRIKGNPDADVAIYRAVPTEYANEPIRPGDWVTLSPSYAQGHVDSTLLGKGRVVKRTAKARDIYSAGDSINEFGYDGPQNLDLSMIDLASPGVKRRERPAVKHVVPPPIDRDATVRAIAEILLRSSRFHRVPSDYRVEVEGLSHLLRPYGIRPRAVAMALSLTHKEGGGRRGTAHAPNARLQEHEATLEGHVLDVRNSEVYFRAGYLANAAQRMQRAMNGGATERDALRREAPYYRMHEEARRGRLKAAAQVQQAARLYGEPTEKGTLVGWYLNPLLNNEVECITANGHNFYAEEGTVIGLPGSVHNRCGCYAGPPIEGATLVNDALHNVVAFQRPSRPKFKIKGRTA